MKPQEAMKERLEQVGIPFKAIECYGSQIVITSWCRESAERWAGLLGRFAKVRGITHSVDYAKENKNTVLRPSTVEVWRTFARIA